MRIINAYVATVVLLRFYGVAHIFLQGPVYMRPGGNQTGLISACHSKATISINFQHCFYKLQLSLFLLTKDCFARILCLLDVENIDIMSRTFQFSSKDNAF